MQPVLGLQLDGAAVKVFSDEKDERNETDERFSFTDDVRFTFMTHQETAYLTAFEQGVRSWILASPGA